METIQCLAIDENFTLEHIKLIGILAELIAIKLDVNKNNKNLRHSGERILGAIDQNGTTFI